MVPNLHSTAHVLAHGPLIRRLCKKNLGRSIVYDFAFQYLQGRRGRVCSDRIEMATHRPAESSGQEANVAGEAYSRARQHVGRQCHRGANTTVAIV